MLNFTASNDWVVSAFPKGMQTLGLQDLGSAGHDGFDSNKKVGLLHEAGKVNGGHGAAVEEPMWDQIARFIIDGRPAAEAPPGIVSDHSYFTRIISVYPPLIWLFLLLAAIALGSELLLLTSLLIPDVYSRGFVGGAVLVAYLYVLWLILVRV